MIHIAVGGARGRMGQLIIQTMKEDRDTILSTEIVRSDLNHYARLGESPIDVWIDFTTPGATLNHVEICAQRGYSMVIGTTGFSVEQRQQIQEAAQKIPIVLSPNMSLGINLSFKLLELAAATLKDQAEIAILDIHHKHKKDAPSGTALKMAEVLQIARGTTSDLGTSKIDISSLRLGDTIGEHTTLFALEGECLEIRHKATDRLAFAKGALQAAKWIMHKGPGLYDMQDVLFSR